MAPVSLPNGALEKLEEEFDPELPLGRVARKAGSKGSMETPVSVLDTERVSVSEGGVTV